MHLNFRNVRRRHLRESIFQCCCVAENDLLILVIYVRIYFQNIFRNVQQKITERNATPLPDSLARLWTYAVADKHRVVKAEFEHEFMALKYAHTDESNSIVKMIKREPGKLSSRAWLALCAVCRRPSL